MTQDDSFPPGTRIGNYEVMSRLGRGGMGMVYLVQQVFLHKRFALKVLNADLASMPEFVQVFRQEARTLASLHHANLVKVHDFGEHEGRSYFLMDYVDGGTVEDRRRLRDGRLSPAETLGLMRGLCAGLGYAHGLGIVHRDLKPENFLIDSEGVPKITDFGLATLVRQPGALTTATRRGDTFMHFARAAESAPALTGGTEGYMAPELRQGAAGDSRSDVYAMGVITYQLLTGKAPVFPLPSLDAEVPGIDPRWNALLTRALAAEPSARFQDGAALRRAFDELAGVRPDGTRGGLPPWLWALPIPLLSVTIFVGALIAHGVTHTEPVAHAERRRHAPEATTPEGPPSTSDIRLKPGDAELGYGLAIQGSPGLIAGWKPGSRAVWARPLPAGRYRLTCSYVLTPALGAPPVRLGVNVGSAHLTCYLPVSSGMSRVRLGEIELSNAAESVEVELMQGAAEGVPMRFGPLFFDPVP